jgi:hypothetical protein
VTAGGVALPRLDNVSQLDSEQGYTFGATGDASGVLRLRHDNAPDISITGPVDTTPPAAVTDLAAGDSTGTSITLTWTAPGDDGYGGTAAGYEIRSRTDAPITETNWSTATPLGGIVGPAAAGTIQSALVSGLTPTTTYYFALKAADEVPNTSAISNSSGATTTRVITIGFARDGVAADRAGANYVNAFRYRADGDLNVVAMNVQIAAPAAGRMKLAVYADGAGSPAAFLRGTEERSSLSTGWQNFHLTAPLALAGGVHYWLAIWTNDNAYMIGATADPDACSYAPAIYGTKWPNPFPANISQSAFRYSLYAAAAQEVTGLILAGDKRTLTWEPLPPRPGPTATYDVMRGLTSDLPVEGKPSETCIASAIATTTATDGTVPASGAGFYYLVRGINDSSKGDYGATSSGAPRSSSACP